MRTLELTQLTDDALLTDLALVVNRERKVTVALLALIAEVDRRRLYAPLGYPSMFAYCVSGLHLSESAAAKRIHAARAARNFPALLDALAKGEIHLAAACLLAPHLTSENAEELLAGATRQSKAEVELLLARRFPRADLPTKAPTIRVLPAWPERRLEKGEAQTSADLFTAAARSSPAAEAPAAPEAPDAPKGSEEPAAPAAPDVVDAAEEHAPGHVATTSAPAPGFAVEAFEPRERFLLRVTIGRRVHDKLRYAQALVSHTVPAGDVEALLERAFDALIMERERRKFARTLAG